MRKRIVSILGLAAVIVAAFCAGRAGLGTATIAAQSKALTAQDYAEITQLLNR